MSKSIKITLSAEGRGKEVKLKKTRGGLLTVGSNKAQLNTLELRTELPISKVGATSDADLGKFFRQLIGKLSRDLDKLEQ